MMKPTQGMTVTQVAPGSPADEEGIVAGDSIIGIGDGPARDEIDLIYQSGEDDLRLIIRHGGVDREVWLPGGGVDIGLTFEQPAIRCCGNNCVFCFIDQNPPGMRAPIYLKDEDYRFSFLHGAYVTLTTLTDEDMDRITEQRLSPLYISVHATDSAVRQKLLGIRRDDRLREKLDRLSDAGILLHTQVVVCPGINDGAVLEETIADLRERYPSVRSVAVVPVGLTGHRAALPALTPVGPADARAVIDLCGRLHKRYRAESGEGFVYCADEWYIRAGIAIPGRAYYDEFPQIENGVGMVRDFLEAAGRAKRHLAKGKGPGGSFVLVTGISMGPRIAAFAEELSAIPGYRVRSVEVTNRFYGESVTVSGLLTGGDIAEALTGRVDESELVVLPPNCLNTEELFLDDMTPAGLAERVRATVVQAGYEPLAVFLGDMPSWRPGD